MRRLHLPLLSESDSLISIALGLIRQTKLARLVALTSEGDDVADQNRSTNEERQHDKGRGHRMYGSRLLVKTTPGA